MCFLVNIIALMIGVSLEFPQLFFCPRDLNGKYYSRCPEIDRNSIDRWWEGVDRDFKGMGVILSGDGSGGATLAFGPLGPHWTNYQTWSGHTEAVFLSRGRFIGEVKSHDQDRSLKRLLIAGYAESCPDHDYSGTMRLAILALEGEPKVLFESFVVPRGTVTEQFSEWVDETILAIDRDAK